LKRTQRKRHEECVLFLEDAFSESDKRRLEEAGYKAVRFADQPCFQSARGKTQQSVKDMPIIRFCNEHHMLLVTTDSDMQFTHVEEIKKNPDVAILATGNKKGSMSQWVEALIILKPDLLRHWKSYERPCFATYNRGGKFTTKKTITERHRTRRNRPREQREEIPAIIIPDRIKQPRPA
jgi:predicted nuclease of predicted toxin-antitoxin system